MTTHTRHLLPHATYGDDPSGHCGCAECDPRSDCSCPSCRAAAGPEAGDYWGETVYDEINREAQRDRARDAPDLADFGVPSRAEAEADAREDRREER